MAKGSLPLENLPRCGNRSRSPMFPSWHWTWIWKRFHYWTILFWRRQTLLVTAGIYFPIHNCDWEKYHWKRYFAVKTCFSDLLPCWTNIGIMFLAKNILFLKPVCLFNLFSWYSPFRRLKHQLSDWRKEIRLHQMY